MKNTGIQKLAIFRPSWCDSFIAPGVSYSRVQHSYISVDLELHLSFKKQQQQQLIFSLSSKRLRNIL